MYIADEYVVKYKDICVGYYYINDDNSSFFRARFGDYENIKEEIDLAGLSKNMDKKKPIPMFAHIIQESNRVLGRKKRIYQVGFIKLEREPKDTGKKFWIYRLSAEKGEDGYSEKSYSAPHYEGAKTPEGMTEWVSWYCFNKMDDGTYQAELDEAWCWGGSHNDGGTIRTPVPEEWHSLDYDEFLKHVVTLSAASHYGFTAEELKSKSGLKEFFGFE